MQTSNYLAKTLSDGGFSVHYVPVFVTLIGFAMSFAAGSVSAIIMLEKIGWIICLFVCLFIYCPMEFFFHFCDWILKNTC